MRFLLERSSVEMFGHELRTFLSVFTLAPAHRLFFHLIFIIAVPLNVLAEDGFVVKFKTHVTDDTSISGIGLKVEHKFGNIALLKSVRSASPPADQPANNTPCHKLRKLGVVEYCENNFDITLQATPSDPYYIAQWAYDDVHKIDIDAPQAWDRSTGSHENIVAIIDTGIDFYHPDLAANMWRNPGEVEGNWIDDDGNGYIDDMHGIDSLAGTGVPLDENGHGTHIAGIIGAVGDNGIGVTGVNWSVSLVAIKFLSGGGAGKLYDLLRAISYVTDLRRRGFNVVAVNMSWVTPNYSQALYDALAEAGAEGVALIAAAGNIASNNDVTPLYPANFDLPQIISVAALQSDGGLASFSNFGAGSVHIAAPGVSIYSTFLGGGYATLSGTSMAAPFVTGAVALLAAQQPGLPASASRSVILQNSAARQELSGLVQNAKLLNLYGILASGGSYDTFISDPPEQNTQKSLKFSKGMRRIMVGGKKSFLVVSGEKRQQGSVQFGLGATQCAIMPFVLHNKYSLLGIRIPDTNLRGALEVRLLDFQGNLRDSETFTLHRSRTRIQRMRSLRRQARTSSTVETTAALSWCSRLRRGVNWPE